MVLPADSDFWKTHFPPWEWGCRCQVVPLSQEDVDAIAKEDADRPEERKLIPTGVRLEQIEKNERMLRGGQTIDLRSPVNKGKPGAFSWNPADLRLPLDELRKRYDAPVWAAFESMARKSTPLGSTTTLWDWLNGSPVVPAPAGKPAPAPSKDEEAAWTALLAKAGVTGKATGWTLKEATRFVKGLQQPLPLEVDDVLALDILNAPTKGPLAKRAVRRHLSHFVRMLPPTLGSGLPKLRVIIAPLPATTGGEYHPGEKAIYLNRLLPNTREVRRVLYHEAMHWVHMEGSADYQARVAAHFAARTRGESIVALPRYSGVVGKLDRWYEAYAGTIYPGAPFDSADGLGVEVPTRYMELVADPRRLSAQLHPNMPHSAHVMETLRIILAPFLQ
jgi:hypothetical protein